MMRKAAIEEAFRRWQAANPHPTTELEFSTPFQLLVAVVLSAQATDKGVNVATRKLFAAAPDAASLAALGEARIGEFVCTINFWRNKARNVAALAHTVATVHGGGVPRDRKALEALPGVGRKTANVVLNTAFGEPTMAVDTHIFRVSNRTGLAPGKDVVEVENALLERVPKEYLRNAHHWILLHGRYVCVARRPKCPACTIRDLCEYRDKTPDPLI